MPDITRLNGVIKALEQGQTAFVAFTPVDIESAVAMASSKLDGVAFEMEHAPLDFPGLRQALQFMLDRRQIVDRATLAPAVTPMVRVPPNGVEMNSWIAKQVLDIGVFGIIFPHVSSVEEAWNAVGACRYPRLSTASNYNPPGIRGDAPRAQHVIGVLLSRNITNAPTSGRWRRTEKFSLSSNAKRLAPSRTCRRFSKRFPASASS